MSRHPKATPARAQNTFGRLARQGCRALEPELRTAILSSARGPSRADRRPLRLAPCRAHSCHFPASPAGPASSVSTPQIGRPGPGSRRGGFPTGAALLTPSTPLLFQDRLPQGRVRDSRPDRASASGCPGPWPRVVPFLPELLLTLSQQQPDANTQAQPLPCPGEQTGQAGSRPPSPPGGLPSIISPAGSRDLAGRRSWWQPARNLLAPHSHSFQRPHFLRCFRLSP